MADKETTKMYHNFILTCYVSHPIVVPYLYYLVETELIDYIIIIFKTTLDHY